MGAIKRTHEYLDKCNVKLSFKGLVWTHAEYAASVWMPLYKNDVQTIENVQHWATRCTWSLKVLGYEESLWKLDLPTLKFHRLQGDMIEVYKILNIYDAWPATNYFGQSNLHDKKRPLLQAGKEAC